MGKYIILFFLLLGCEKKHHFVYSDGSYEDLYVCYVYPSGFRMDFAGVNIETAYAQARYFSSTYVPSTDNIACARAEKQ